MHNASIMGTLKRIIDEKFGRVLKKFLGQIMSIFDSGMMKKHKRKITTTLPHPKPASSPSFSKPFKSHTLTCIHDAVP